MKIYIKQFGCPTLKFFASELSSQLFKAGFEILESKPGGKLDINKDDFLTAQKATACVFYTCGLIEFCQEEIAHYIKKIRSSCPKTKLIVTGCNVEQYNSISEKSVNFASSDSRDIIQYLRKTYPQQTSRHGTTINNKYSAEEIVEILAKSNCRRYCSYCVEPIIRNASHPLSRHHSHDEILCLIKKAEKAGAKKIRLVGPCIGDWRDKKTGITFTDLLKSILKNTSVTIHHLEFHPNDINECLIDLLLAKRIEKNLSIPIESGSNKILKKMHRGYDVCYIETLFGRLYRSVPNIGIDTDIIVGFPGETEKDFLDTCALLKKLKLRKVFAMRYNKRRDTMASALSQQLPEHIKRHRLLELSRILRAHNIKVFLRDIRANA